MKINGTNFCRLRRWDGMILTRINTDILMSRHPILYWNDWSTPDIYGKEIHFWIMVVANAENFPVPESVDRFYFFNPFSLEILQKVASRILESYYAAPREMLLFFYYPSDEYISYLMTVDEILFLDEIDCRDLFQGNDLRERIVIFEL